jgi:nucleotide-binding universal stress UspA family protein
VYGLIRAGETAWIDPVVVWCLGFGVVLLLVFVVVERVAAHPLFDLSLTRTPTFAGGLIAAFTMNGSLFAALVFLALYIQDGLGFSPLGTGERLLVLSAATMAPRIIAGRLTGRIGVRWFIGPGLALVGAGLLLMARVGGADPWTHFVPGFVVAGIGSGLVNPPLASTAVGVVAPRRSGMASGVNTTFRQIGLAMSVAALGTVFAAALHHGVDRRLAAVPGLAGEGPSVVAAIRHGQIRSLLASVGPESRTRLESAVHASFAGALHEVLVVAGAIALVGGLCSFLLIRSQDFVAVEAAAGRPPPEPGGAEPVKVAAGPACEPAATGPYRNILAVVDVYRDGAAVLRRAVGLAERDNARLTLMSIVPAPSRWVWLAPQLPCDPRHELEADSVVRLRAAAGTVPALLPVIMVLRHGPPTRCLEAELSTGVYDVAIVGRPRSGRSARAAARLRRRAPVPVLVVGDQSPRMGSAVGTPDWTIPTDPSLTSSAQA